MTLRNKALIIIGFAIVCLVGLIYASARLILLQDLIELEEHDSYQNVERVLSTWYSTASTLEAITLDWAAWDDTYAFIEDNDSGYIESNLVSGTFVNLRINLMLFIDSSGQIVFSKAFDLENEAEIPVPNRLNKYLSDNRSLLEQPGVESSSSGIIRLDEGPMLISSQPILTSNKQGPARGTLIFGRYINSVEINQIAQMTLLRISLHSIDSPPKDANFQEALVSLLKGTTIFVQPLNNQYVAGYTVLNDIDGKPAYILQVDSPRDIYQQGQISIAYYIFMMLGIGIISGGIVMWTIERQVMSRFVRLTKGVEGIASSGDLSTRLSISGADELTMMAGTINGMLAALQESGAELNKLYEHEKQLRQELQEEMNRRIEYTRALVHELKTPLTPVLAASDMLLEEVKEEPILSLSRSIYQGAMNLNRRIDELLDLARSEIGTLSVHPAVINTRELLQEIANGVQSLALANKQQFKLEMPSYIPKISADRERLTQVIQNMINNAMKFTAAGGVITLRALKDDTNFIVEVEDTGRGISEEDQKRLFNPYYRLSSDRERFSGLGLGLALSKKLVELHGGQMWVKSEKGKGTTFGFSIPLNPPPKRNKELNQGGKNEGLNH